MVPVPLGREHEKALVAINDFMSHIAALTGGKSVKLSMEEKS